GFAAAQVEVETAKSEAIGAGAGPIDLVAAEGQVAVLVQPGVKIHRAAEAAEAVIGEDEQHGVVIDLPHGFAYESIHALVEVGDGALPLRIASSFEMAIEHVLHPVAGVEDAGHYTVPGVGERVIEHGFAFGEEG